MRVPSCIYRSCRNATGFLKVPGALLLILLSGSVAADTLLEGDLGRWLEDDVAPPLADALSRHPRFEGETVRLTTVTGDVADGSSNRLAQAVESRLRQRLLAVEGVRLAVEQPQSDCAPPPPVTYLVRVEVTARNGRDARVHVAVVDVVESIWVSGLSYQWQGRLSSAERRALDEPVVQRLPGSAGSPIPVIRARDVALAMKADLICLLPRDLEGSVYVVTPDTDALARVALALQSELRYEPVAVLTPDRDQARWVLSLDDHAAGADVRELRALLAAADGGPGQQVGSVFIAGAAPAPQVAVANDPPAERPELLSPITLAAAREEGICDARKARVNSCVEVAFELEARAYLFVVSTQDHLLTEVPCDSLSEAEPGPRRFRLRIPPGGYAANGADRAPDAGFYVLAARDRDVARRLQATLAAAPGQCGSAGARSAAGWLADLRQLLERHGDDVSWRAVQLVHGPGGIAAL